MSQAILPLIPDGATPITDKLSVIKKDSRWIYFHGWDPIFSHGEDEIETFRMFTAQLICHGVCRNKLKILVQDDARSLIRDLFLSEADILPDTDNKILNVCIHHTAEARHNRAIEHLVQHLNDADYKYPGTKLTMRFSLGAPELPAPGG